MSVIDDFRAVCKVIPYINKGIFYSELYLFLRECHRRRVDLIIESGVKHGFSTRIIAQAYDGNVISIDREIAIKPINHKSTLIEGDSIQIIPELLERHADKRIGVLLDGPKGLKALALKDACLSHPAVKLVGIHDVARGNGERLHSHDESFRARYGRKLDEMIHTDYAAKYPNGPGLGIWT